MKKSLVVCIFMLIVVAACQPQSIATPVPALVSTSEPSEASTPTLTLTPEPTTTPLLPTITFPPRPTIPPSPTSTPSPTNTPTPRPSASSVIAFTMAQGDQRSVYVIAPDGSGQTQLRADVAQYSRPQWSPGGQYLAFLSGESRNTALLNILDYTSGDARQLDFPGVTTFAWSPDGQHIAFTTEPETQGNHFLRTDPLAGQHAPYYLFGMSIADLQPTPIIELHPLMHTFRVAWMPRGDRIVTLNQPAGPEAFAFLYPFLGYNQNHVTDQYVVLSDVAFVGDIAIDPTGEWVALTSMWDEDARQITVVKLDDSNDVMILDTDEPANRIDWSPDGSMLAYSSLSGWCNGCAPEYQASGVYVRFVETGTTLEIAPPDAHAYAPAFSPDSAYLVYLTATQNVDATGYALNVYSFAMGTTTKIVSAYVGVDQPTWQP